MKCIPKAATTISQLKATGSSQATIAFGRLTSAAAARALETKCNVPCDILDLPIGLAATDRFIEALSNAANVPIPTSIEDERGRLIDMITDMHQYFYGKTVALWGDPDQLVSLAEFLVSIDMKPVYIVTGTPGKKFLRRIEKALKGEVPHAKVKQGL